MTYGDGSGGTNFSGAVVIYQRKTRLGYGKPQRKTFKELGQAEVWRDRGGAIIPAEGPT